jgi:hypothetical protein
MVKDTKDNRKIEFVAEDGKTYTAGQLLQSKRAKIRKTCEICGDGYVGYTNKLTCSARCRKAKSRLSK